MRFKLSSYLFVASVLTPLLMVTFIGVLATRPDLLQELSRLDVVVLELTLPSDLREKLTSTSR
ncbi:MAG: hypothetical protein QXH78_01375 [Desulfurococcaceae archaeon]